MSTDSVAPSQIPEARRGTYPIEWIERTFTSPAVTAELLKPELEEGCITPNDYRLAQAFFPGNYRFVKLSLGATVGGLFGAIAWTRRPRWNPGKMSSFVSLGFGGGYIYGTFRQASGHMKFQAMLEDPVGMEQAMENVNIRQGGTNPLNITFRFKQVSNGETSSSIRQQSHTADSTTWPSDSGTDAPPAPPPLPNVSQKRSPVNEAVQENGRWAQIRKANNPSAQDSSWDRLRQTHERAGMKQPAAAAPGSSATSSNSPERYSGDDDERARQQAEFDALLEAERRLGQEDPSRPTVERPFT